MTGMSDVPTVAPVDGGGRGRGNKCRKSECSFTMCETFKPNKKTEAEIQEYIHIQYVYTYTGKGTKKV